MTQMERSLESHKDATTYPRDVADSALAAYTVDAISHRLDTQAHRLFADETQASLDFIDLGNNAEGVWHSHHLEQNEP